MLKAIRIDVKLKASDTSADTPCSPFLRVQLRSHATVSGDRPHALLGAPLLMAQQCSGQRGLHRDCVGAPCQVRGMATAGAGTVTPVGTKTVTAQQTLPQVTCGGSGGLCPPPCSGPGSGKPTAAGQSPLNSVPWETPSRACCSLRPGTRVPTKASAARPALTWPQVCRDWGSTVVWLASSRWTRGQACLCVPQSQETPLNFLTSGSGPPSALPCRPASYLDGWAQGWVPAATQDHLQSHCSLCLVTHGSEMPRLPGLFLDSPPPRRSRSHQERSCWQGPPARAERLSRVAPSLMPGPRPGSAPCTAAKPGGFPPHPS